MAIGHKLGLRLFIEGIEIPVIGADIQIVPDQPASASIQIIATDKALELLPRTLVHLFFYDFVEATSPLPLTEAGNNRLVDLFVVGDEENSKYKLLFMGEVQGLGFQKSSDQRSIVLNCIDFSNYWDTTYQYNFQGEVIGGRQKAAFIGANSNLLTSPLGHGEGTFSQLLGSSPVSFPNMKGLLGGIIRCLEAIGGAYYGVNTFAGANDFASIAELRLKLLQQITAAEKDTSTVRLFSRKVFNKWMNRQIGSLGEMVTFRGVIGIMQSFIYHQVFACPVAKYQGEINGLKRNLPSFLDIENDKRPIVKAFVTNVFALKKTCSSLITGLGTYSGLQASGSNQSAVLATQETLQAEYSRMGDLVKNITGAATPDIPGVLAQVTEISGKYSEVKLNIASGGAKINMSTVIDVGKRSDSVSAINRVVVVCDNILALGTKHIKTITYSQLPRVNNQIFRPDLWWAAAPRCNVIFPEMYSTLTWSRNFLREVTRLELQTTNEILGDDAMFNGRYYAPNIADMRAGIKLSSRKFGRLIMQHELLTGILPVYEKMTDANIFAMKSREVSGKGAKVGYTQRAANFQYFKHRFASRQLSAQGRFNPWFVAGFPSIIIDRPLDSHQAWVASRPIAEQAAQVNIHPTPNKPVKQSDILRKLVGPQFMGSCEQLTHSLSQQGGSTSYMMAQARIHREDTEYLGVDKVTVNRVEGSPSYKTLLVSSYPETAPQLKGRGVGGGIITKIVDVTDSHRGQSLPQYGNSERLIVGHIQDATSSEVQALNITETYTRRVRADIDLPIEEVIRPPWVWDGWSNILIGETYMQFFGTNAITDVSENFSQGVSNEQTSGLYADAGLVAAKKQEGLTSGSGQVTNVPKPKSSKKTKVPRAIKPNAAQNSPEKQLVTTTEAQRAADSSVSAVSVEIVETERTIENSVDRLVRAYSLISKNGLDVGAFIRNYSWRPVATMTEILGSADLLIVEDAKNNSKVERGTEGFHSRAFGDQGDLFGLVNPQVKKVLGFAKSADPAAAKRLDIRGIRRSVVHDYVEELTNSRGLLG